LVVSGRVILSPVASYFARVAVPASASGEVISRVQRLAYPNSRLDHVGSRIEFSVGLEAEDAKAAQGAVTRQLAAAGLTMAWLLEVPSGPAPVR
jgi:hypothetical protein